MLIVRVVETLLWIILQVAVWGHFGRFDASELRSDVQMQIIDNADGWSKLEGRSRYFLQKKIDVLRLLQSNFEVKSVQG